MSFLERSKATTRSNSPRLRMKNARENAPRMEKLKLVNIILPLGTVKISGGEKDHLQKARTETVHFLYTTLLY